MQDQQSQDFVEGNCYTRKEIGPVVGGDTQQRGLAWTKNKRVSCAILRKDHNLAPPDVILVGAEETRFERGEALCEQQGSIPVFVTEGKVWYSEEEEHRYCGRYRVLGWSEDPHTLPLWGKAARNRKDSVGRVIFLEKAD